MNRREFLETTTAVAIAVAGADGLGADNVLNQDGLLLPEDIKPPEASPSATIVDGGLVLEGYPYQEDGLETGELTVSAISDESIHVSAGSSCGDRQVSTGFLVSPDEAEMTAALLLEAAAAARRGVYYGIGE